MGEVYAGGGRTVDPLQPVDDVRTILRQPHGYGLFTGEHLTTAYDTMIEGAMHSRSRQGTNAPGTALVGIHASFCSADLGDVVGDRGAVTL